MEGLENMGVILGNTIMSVQLIWIELCGGLFSQHNISPRVVCIHGSGWLHHRPQVYYALFADDDNFELPCDVNLSVLDHYCIVFICLLVTIWHCWF